MVPHAKHRFQTGMELSAYSVPVEDPRKEIAALYKTSGLKVVKNAEGETPAGPPFMACRLTWKPIGLGDIAA